ncbi:MAG TPA: carbohydrate kinase family protein [Fimbriimonadaceae bacterium]|nr:carbohydrate kinase family protein [Fimbriimonadaceae bacterium]
MILAFGTVCLDRIRRVPHMPEPGGYVEISSEVFALGGEAANTAIALQAWGSEVVLAGNGLGRDPRLAAAVRDSGLRFVEDHVVQSGETPVCDVYVADDGERTMIGQGFSAMAATVDPSLLPFKSGEWFTAEPNMHGPAREAVRLAHQAGMRIYAMDFVDAADPVFEGSYWQSSTDWVGKRGNARANLAWVRKWIDEYGCFTILTDGPNGFVAGSPDSPPRLYPPYPCAEVVDATGSGDIFRAGMLFGLDQGWRVTRCLEFASAAGCLACQALGATASIPSSADVEALISRASI